MVQDFKTILHGMEDNTFASYWKRENVLGNAGEQALASRNVTKGTSPHPEALVKSPQMSAEASLVELGSCEG